MLWIMATTGCATVIKGSSQTVRFDSNPRGAEVYIDEQRVGSTPIRHSLKHGDDYYVEFRMPGYQTHLAKVTSSFSGHSLWLFPYSLLFDALVGNMNTIDQEEVVAQMVASPGGAPPPTKPPVAVTPTPAPTPAPAPPPASGALPAGPEMKVAVLEFVNQAELSSFEIESVTDMVRSSALAVPTKRLFVMTRENILEMLPPGIDLASCEGACEVETGRNVGADLVVSGSVGKFGDRVQVKMKLHDTRSGRLLGAQVVSAASVTDLEGAIKKAGAEMFSTAIRKVSGS